MRWLVAAVVLVLGGPVLAADQKPAPRSMPFRDLTGQAEEFRFIRMWRSYYWREDFTFVLRTDDGKTIRVISREPTPWNDLRLGTTYTGLKVNWNTKPRVQVIGVAAIDRIPEEIPHGGRWHVVTLGVLTNSARVGRSSERRLEPYRRTGERTSVAGQESVSRPSQLAASLAARAPRQSSRLAHAPH